MNDHKDAIIEEQRRLLKAAQAELDLLYAFAISHGISEAGDPLHRQIARYLETGEFPNWS